MHILRVILERLKNKKIKFDWNTFKLNATSWPWTIQGFDKTIVQQNFELEKKLAETLATHIKNDIDNEILQSITTKAEEQMSKQVIGICGLIGSGKDTVGQLLVDEFGFTKVSFAGTLKDMTAVLFDWDRDMLEGTTPETRAEREVSDPFWSEKLGRDWSPRIALQQMGTEVIRNHLDTDMWIHTVENKIRKLDKVVITDCRFPNEIDFVKKHGEIWVVDRGTHPAWFEKAARYNRATPKKQQEFEALGYGPTSFGVHASEYSWAGVDATRTIDNNGSIEGLYKRVRSQV